MRVLIASHMHPRVSRGGGEIAAYQMYSALLEAPGVDAYLLAASGGKFTPPLGVSIFQPFDEREYVVSSHSYDHFIHANPDTAFLKHFEQLLLDLQPDIVHFHHYTNFGVEVFAHVKRLLPDAKIVVTLHEFLAICNHFGQMVKRPGFGLCREATPRDCATCFPERSENDFFLRRQFLGRFFDLVDHFISPSRFLADRYVQWGLPQDAMAVIENGMPDLVGERIAPPPVEDGLVIGLFGQLSKLKGLDVVLQAAAMLSATSSGAPSVRIDIHGDASNQPREVRADLQPEDGNASVVRFCGAYEHKDVGRLMQGCHAILVPSIWWENSPLVIQEALAMRRPVICSNIGGMAEKVRDGIDGFHFQAGDGTALARLLIDLRRNPARLANLSDTLAIPPTLQETVGQTLDLYRHLISGAAGGSAAMAAQMPASLAV